MKGFVNFFLRAPFLCLGIMAAALLAQLLMDLSSTCIQNILHNLPPRSVKFEEALSHPPRSSEPSQLRMRRTLPSAHQNQLTELACSEAPLLFTLAEQVLVPRANNYLSLPLPRSLFSSLLPLSPIFDRRCRWRIWRVCIAALMDRNALVVARSLLLNGFHVNEHNALASFLGKEQL